MAACLAAAIVAQPARAAAPAPLICAGADTMQALVARWGRAYARKPADGPPGISVEAAANTRLSADGFTALIAGRVGCVTFARELFPAETAAYEAHFGVRPHLIPVAGGSFATLHATHAIAIYVNAANPLTQVSLGQLRSVFADLGAAPRTWGALGLGGVWAHAPLHVYGMAPYRSSGNPPGIVNFLEQKLLGGAPFRSDLRVVAGHRGDPALAAIVRRVAADPDAIGYSGFGFGATGAKTLALVARPGTAAIAGTAANGAARRYPLARTIYLLFASHTAGAMAFARFALGSQGQALVPGDDEHFIALTRGERTGALAALRAPYTAPVALGPTRRLPHWRPAAVQVPPHASYMTADGAISIVGYNDMRTALAAVDILFMAAHPGTRFSLTLEGTRTAPRALMNGTSLLAPMGADFEDPALAAYRKRIGAAPLRVRVAHDALDPAARSSPLAVLAHRDNPLNVLTLAQLRTLFAPTAARPQEAGGAPHLYGLAPGTALGRYLLRGVFAGRSFDPHMHVFTESRALIEALRRDRDGIGIADLNQRTPDLKVVALARCDRCRPVRGTARDLITGRYPLDRHLLIFVRRMPGRPLDPVAREYLHLVLSREGQAAIAAAPPHYLPLSPRELALGRANLR